MDCFLIGIEGVDVVICTTHGSLSSFDPTVEDWRSYVERFLHYCEANDITSPERKRAVLLSVCGAKTYQVIRNLTSPIEPGEKPLNEIIDLVTKHYSPKPSIIVQHFRFNSCSRDKGESIATFIATLRQLSEFCEYGDTLEDMLRDRLVCGVNDERIQRRLLSEPNLTFTTALQLAQAIESADKDSRNLKTSQPPTGVVHYNKSTKHTSTKPKRYICTRCGGNHLVPNCRFKSVECRVCKKVGHIA